MVNHFLRTRTATLPVKAPLIFFGSAPSIRGGKDFVQSVPSPASLPYLFAYTEGRITTPWAIYHDTAESGLATPWV